MFPKQLILLIATHKVKIRTAIKRLGAILWSNIVGEEKVNRAKMSEDSDTLPHSRVAYLPTKEIATSLNKMTTFLVICFWMHSISSLVSVARDILVEMEGNEVDASFKLGKGSGGINCSQLCCRMFLDQKKAVQIWYKSRLARQVRYTTLPDDSCQDGTPAHMSQ